MDSSVTLTVALLIALSVLILSVSLMSVTMILSIRWTNRMRDRQTQVLVGQMSHLRVQQTDLLNRLMSKDAITYSTLVAQTNSSDLLDPVHGLTPIGTDEDEYERYQAMMGQQAGFNGAAGVGSESYDDTADLYDAGLIPDESGYRYAE